MSNNFPISRVQTVHYLLQSKQKGRTLIRITISPSPKFTSMQRELLGYSISFRTKSKSAIT